MRSSGTFDTCFEGTMPVLHVISGCYEVRQTMATGYIGRPVLEDLDHSTFASDVGGLDVSELYDSPFRTEIMDYEIRVTAENSASSR